MIDRYSHLEITNVWSDLAKYRHWYEIEYAYFCTIAPHLNIPRLQLTEVHVSQIKRIENKTKHDVAAFVEWLEERYHCLIGRESRYVHYGLTSSDITDTTLSMQIRSSDAIITLCVERLTRNLSELRNRHPDQKIAGRTHGQVAEPLDLHRKIRSWRDSISLNWPEVQYFGRLCGSVGDSKHMREATGLLALQKLGLTQDNESIDGQIIHRAHYANHMNRWAVLASCAAKIATDIRLLAQTGIEEMAEGFDPGQVGSSSMPHKKNPINCEKIVGLARVVRGYQSTAMQNIELWNERDLTNSSVERIIFSDAAQLLYTIISELHDVVQRLVLNLDRMNTNLVASENIMLTQTKMLAKVRKGSARAAAHKSERKKK